MKGASSPLLLITHSALVGNLLLSDSRGANHVFPAASHSRHTGAHGRDLYAGTLGHSRTPWQQQMDGLEAEAGESRAG